MRVIDVRHLGRPGAIGAWLVDGVLVDPGPASGLEALLQGLGDEVPHSIALTHIHLDHAGATGTLCARWPDVEVWVHEHGARHLVDPERLLASATRLYGDDMDRLWGEVRPVPRDRIRVFEPGPIGGFRVADAPGHASHHVILLHEDSGTLFAGDVAGVHIEGTPVIAPTPPPDIDLDAWAGSLELIEAWDPARLAITHFGAREDVQAQIDEVRAWLDAWGPKARATDERTWVEEHRTWIAERSDPDAAAGLEQVAPFEQCWQGLDRYWRRRAG
jgi:glyoxylase-like metal-dependent hydrolase (beta-lactamase superfamily II)